MTVAVFAVSQITLFYAVKYVVNTMTDAQNGGSRKARKKGKQALAQAGLSDEQMAELDLNEYEQTMASEIIPPASIGVSFESIGGLDEIISSLRETVIYPLTFPELFGSGNGLLSAPKGVLLYGHPGCGKTMLAKALAKESGATFINMPLSSL
jgi:ATP-dependent 26S proteasome regulatory subunit